MTRLRTVLTIMLPSMLAGGLAFSVASGQAASSDDGNVWAPSSSPVLLAQATPPKPPRAVPPKAPPEPPIPPLKDMIGSQLEAARAQIVHNPVLSKATKDKILARLDKVKAAIDKRMVNLKITDFEQFGDEMEKMGEEIEGAMDGLGDEIEKSMQKDLKFNFKHDDNDDDDEDLPSAPDVDIDPDDSDLRDAISELKDLALKPAQRDQITKLRTDSDGKVATAKKQIADLSTKLQTALGDSKTTDAEISRYVDQISAQEASIRKARIIAWAQARRVLDAAQRQRVEAAAKKTK